MSIHDLVMGEARDFPDAPMRPLDSAFLSHGVEIALIEIDRRPDPSLGVQRDVRIVVAVEGRRLYSGSVSTEWIDPPEPGSPSRANQPA